MSMNAEGAQVATPTPVFRTALISMLLWWLSFPPVGIGLLAWIAPVPLVLLSLGETFSGRRPYLKLYLAGFVYWLTTFYFIPIPHPALWGGWLAVSAYMAVYTPLLVAVSRVSIHEFRVPPVVVLPIVGTGIEYIRCHFATGMPMVCLSHSQYEMPVVIQIADLSGAYTVTALIWIVATAIAIGILHWGPIRKWGLASESSRQGGLVSICVAAGLLVASLVYGNWQLGRDYRTAEKPLSVSLVQTSEDVVFRALSELENEQRWRRLIDLHRQALSDDTAPDLIVWPESAFNPYYDLLSDAGAVSADLAEYNLTSTYQVASTIDGNVQLVPLLAGINSYDPANELHFNAAILLQGDSITDRYFKRHLVMFGEYVPLADQFAWIQSLSPLRNCNAGETFESFEVNGMKVAPNICFESTVPHLIRHQVNSLTEQGQEPDVLVNITNDGWFFGTSCLDLHLACNVFRAVEMRKPLAVCANTGFSAHIDLHGRLLQIGPRRAEAVLRCSISKTSATSVYRTLGDWIPWGFGMAVLLIITGSVLTQKKKFSTAASEDKST